jgi:hypothetical protein
LFEPVTKCENSGYWKVKTLNIDVNKIDTLVCLRDIDDRHERWMKFDFFLNPSTLEDEVRR